jgi:hypothetical protein
LVIVILKIIVIINYNGYFNKCNKLVIKVKGKEMQGEGLFKVEDINSIIRLFAYRIQERFDEVDGICSGSGEGRQRYFLED